MTTEKLPGMKFDGGKIRYELLPPEVLFHLAAIYTFGALKYKDDNWKTIKDGLKRGVGSLIRHVEAYRRGEYLDPDSGVPHLACVMAQASFLLWRQRGRNPRSYDFSAVAAKYDALRAEQAKKELERCKSRSRRKSKR